MQNLLWLDLETTGLDPQTDTILEFGAIVTDWQLNELAEFHALIAVDVEKCKRNANDYVNKMHEENGLWEALDRALSIDSALLIEDADVAFREFAEQHNAVGGPIAGFSPHFDRSFLEVDCPEARSAFNHRTFDVSTFRQWFINTNRGIEVPEISIGTLHRALDDTRSAVAAMRSYRGRIL